MKYDIHYQMIRNFYGDQAAERSKVPLINHINEGLSIMLREMAPTVAMAAYCLHPMLQSDDTLQVEIHRDWIQHVDPKALLLAMEYRRVANSYLCTPKTDGWSAQEARTHIGMILPAVHAMLRADKLQNQKDFIIHHMGTHPRSEQLTTYFDNWLDILGVHREDRWMETRNIPHGPLVGHTYWAVGEGWKDIINSMLTEAAALGLPVTFSTIKEKFGQLRLYFRTYGGVEVLRQVQDLVDKTEDLATTTCDVCGGHTHVATHWDHGYGRTRCPIHTMDGIK